jgi:hypothetical protein
MVVIATRADRGRRPMARKYTFAPTTRAFLEEARGAGNRYAFQALGELNHLEALVRVVLRHRNGNRDKSWGEATCSCSGPRECLLHIVEAANEIDSGKKPLCSVKLEDES